MKVKQRMPLQSIRRRYPIGAEVTEGGTHFRVWARDHKRVELVIEPTGERYAMSAEPSGHFSLFVEHAGAGTRYRFMIDGRGPFPDPASRFQPDGPHGASQVIDAAAFDWSDHGRPGVGARNQVLYELHIGTFTREGTWLAASEQLPALAELGITTLEVMPVAEFAGRFGWGYDGVDPFAPTRLYGSPDDMRRFVDRAHALGIGVILDVVYNHFGPDGNYLNEFCRSYISTRYENEWGEPINFDDDAEHVREYFLANAAYWIDEFHLDGLRLDATQQIFDASPRHIVQDVAAAVRRAGGRRATYVVAENETQDAALVRQRGVDALWNDDFHHSAIVAATGRAEAYYSNHNGSPQELLSALKYGFLFQGQHYAWQKQTRGTPSLDLKPHNFVHFLENHDQVANSSRGDRLHQVASAGRVRTLTAVLLLGPQTPMLFQGQEFASSKPFLYFTDHHPDLAAAVAKGRADFLAQFPSAAAARASLAVPHDVATFERCKLDHAERRENAAAWNLHRDLIALRKSDPVFADPERMRIDGSIIAAEAFVLRYFSRDHGDRLLVINLGRDIAGAAIPDPLVAPEANARWRMLWSSEDVRYAGTGAIQVEHDGVWHLPGHSAAVLATDRG